MVAWRLVIDTMAGGRYWTADGKYVDVENVVTRLNLLEENGRMMGDTRLVAELEAQVKRMCSVLRALEWEGYEDDELLGGYWVICPSCSAREEAGHKDDCELAAVIREICS